MSQPTRFIELRLKAYLSLVVLSRLQLQVFTRLHDRVAHDDSDVS